MSYDNQALDNRALVNRLLDNKTLANAIEEISRGDRTYILTANQIRGFSVNIYNLYLEGRIPPGSGINGHVVKNALLYLSLKSVEG